MNARSPPGFSSLHVSQGEGTEAHDGEGRVLEVECQCEQETTTLMSPPQVIFSITATRIDFPTATDYMCLSLLIWSEHGKQAAHHSSKSSQ